MKPFFIIGLLVGLLFPGMTQCQGFASFSFTRIPIFKACIKPDSKLQTQRMPVQMRFFQLSGIGHSVLLKWETTTEYQNNYFEIQRSVNGEPFRSLTLIFAKEDRLNGAAYSFTDYLDDPLLHTEIIYRLVQVSQNGVAVRMAFHRILESERSEPHFMWNETIFHSSLQVSMGAAEAGDLILDVYEANGQLRFSEEFGVLPGFNIFSIYNLEEMQPGYYVVEVKDPHQVLGRQTLQKKY